MTRFYMPCCALLLQCSSLSAGLDDIITALSSSDEKRVLESLSRILEAGPDAFPALLRHMHDPRLANESVFPPTRARTERSDKHPLQNRKTVGNACFDIISVQVEGTMPHIYRPFRALQRKNIAAWVRKHAGKSLDELRLLAVEESIRRVRSASPREIEEATRQRALDFFLSRQRQLQLPDLGR